AQRIRLRAVSFKEDLVFVRGRKARPESFETIHEAPGWRSHVPRRPRASRYTSRLRERDARGLRTFTRSKRARNWARNSSNPSPWKTLTRNAPPGFRIFTARSSASSARYIALGWSTASMPLMLGAMSDITRSARSAPSVASSRSSGSSSVKSPCRNSTPSSGSISRISSATMRPRAPSLCAAYWLQPPGAAPRSTTVMPGRSRRSFASISSSLNTARERRPSACARFTYSSAKCSPSQRELLFDRFAIFDRVLGYAPVFDPAATVTNPKLNDRQRKHLRGLAHDLNVVVQTGAAGLTDAVLAEIDAALSAHELIKVRFVAGE